jgi:integrase
MKAISNGSSPYVFIPKDRLAHILRQRSDGQWIRDGELLNNVTRALHAICKKAKVPYYTLHDLRRSCITNWARTSPIHVVRQLAGHSNLDTTCKYYLSVPQSDIEAIRAIQDKCIP